MATTSTSQGKNKAVYTPAVWSYGVGDDASVDSMLSARFLPMLQHQAATEESKVMMDQELEIPKSFSVSTSAIPKNRRGSLKCKPRNRQQSMELDEIFPSLSCKEEQPVTSSNAVWTYGVGDDASIDDDSMNFSARFIPVSQNHQTSKSSIDMMNDFFEAMEPEQEESEDLFSISSSARPTNRRSSMEFGPSRRQSMDLNEVFPSLSCEDEPQGVTILEETSDNEEEQPQGVTVLEETSDHEDIEVPLLSSPSATFQNKRSSYSDSWNELQLTPSDLLSKLLPDKVKKAQARISAKKQEEKSDFEDIEVPFSSSPQTTTSKQKRSFSDSWGTLQLSCDFLSERLPQEAKKAQTLKPTKEQEESSDHEDTELPLAPKRERSDSDSWGELQITSEMLSKLLPDKVKRAQTLMSPKSTSKKSRSKRRSSHRKSLAKLDPSDADSNHTDSTEFLSDSFNCNDQEPTLEDKKAWGVDGIEEDLQSAASKKKKSRRKSTSKKSDKTKTKEKRRSSLRKSSSSTKTDKLDKEERRKKKSSDSSSVRSKDKKKKSKSKSTTSRKARKSSIF